MPSKKPHILIIVENLPVPFDRRVWLESLALIEAGYAVTVICPMMKGFQKPRETLDNIDIYRHPLPVEGDTGAFGFLIEYSVAFFWETWLAWKVFFKHRFHAIHACNPPDNIFLIGWMFKLLGVKFVFDQHDINPELYIAKYGRKDFFYRLMCFLERRTYRTADMVISTNQSYRNIAMVRGGVPSEKIYIVRSAPDTAKFRSVAPDPELKRGKPFLVAYLGVMGKQEGVDLLLQAIRHLLVSMQFKDAHFVLIGGGPEKPHLEKLADDYNLSTHLEFTGRIPDAELLTWLSSADVCVNPDRVNEMNDKSTMNKIMEYMAVGKPIVQFETTEGRYSAADASLYAKPNDPVDFAEKIHALLMDEGRRETMGNIGLERMQNQLDWQYSKSALLAAYRTILPLSETAK